ncbi:peptidylprolyl isomerase [Candidatus Dojkabacteria bacterium]|nr:peptidylprolyl isomerase [Candidatus Dojkabacteria bacterium]
MSIDTSKNYKAVFKTNYGDFEIDLYERNAPVAVNNFVFLVNEDYYDGVKFHRLAKGLLIQAGDRNTLDSNLDNDGLGGPGYTFEDEINWDSMNFSNAKIQQLENLGYSTNSEVESLHLEQKSIALANDGPNTNGSQFFIVTASSDDKAVKGLEGRHTVFGIVISGWEVILNIENIEVDDPSSNFPRPLEDIIINDIEIKVS